MNIEDNYYVCYYIRIVSFRDVEMFKTYCNSIVSNNLQYYCNSFVICMQ